MEYRILVEYNFKVVYFNRLCTKKGVMGVWEMIFLKI